MEELFTISLMGSTSNVRMIDALLNMDSGKEFTCGELAEESGLGKSSVYRRIDDLVQYGVVSEVESSAAQRYQFNRDSEMGSALFTIAAEITENHNN